MLSSAATDRRDVTEAGVTVSEVRVLDGPNLYFTRPAVKISLEVPGYLALDRKDAVELARRVGLGSSRPGKAGTAQRQRFVMRLAAHVMRRIASGVGVSRITVRSRTGSAVDEIVAAIPWRHRNWGEVSGEQLGPVLAELLRADRDGTDAVDAIIEAAAARVRAVEPGPASLVVAPTVPVVSITGTNGKTTTTRIIAHISMTAGFKTAWSSTSGVVVMGETIDAGDYSGPAGAREVLATPGLEIGVLETARGGMLLRGMGVSTNDVSIVTNVTADHLGLQGIDTLDQLAEVKAIVTTITKPTGWVVLNGDDPRVWAMRHRIKAKPWGLDLGCAGGAKLDFRKATVTCELLLCETGEAVAARTTEALQFSVRPAKNGLTASVEVRISVLSSQLEGALFNLFDSQSITKISGIQYYFQPGRNFQVSAKVNF